VTITSSIAALFDGHPHRVFAPTDLREALPDVNEETIRKTLARLCARRVLVHDGYGRYRSATAPTTVECSCHSREP
jgi:hypothetical protein